MSKTVFIYWLLDVRPEMIAAGYHSGYPFYCGKALDPSKRLKQHVGAAQYDDSKKSRRIVACGSFLRVHVVETILPGCNWEVREKSWIRLIRFCFPDNCNISAGGRGGLAYHEMTRAQRSNHRWAIRNSPRVLMAAGRKRIKMREKHSTIMYRIRRHKKKLAQLRADM
jgi:hypothetical protein